MDPQKQQQACALLYQHWLDGALCDGLPEDVRPQSRDDAYRVQAWIEGFSTQPPVGWKIAATSTAGQAHIGVDGPMAGRLLAERQLANGGDFTLGNNLMKVAELEFAFRFGKDLAPRGTPYRQDEVLAAVSELCPAIELPDSRYRQFERAGAPQLIADNACAHRFLLGEPAPDDWRGLDLTQYEVQGFRNGRHVETGRGANVLGDPRTALTWLVNELSGIGVTVKKGQAVITGTCVKPIVIAVGDRIEGDFGRLGRVSVAIV